MTTSRRLSVLGSAAVLAAGLALMTPAHAQTEPLAKSTAHKQAYAPGTATAHKPTVDPVWTDHKNYSCSFAQWRAGAIVQWHCDLYDRHLNDAGFLESVLIKAHSGSWTPPPKTHSTPTYSDRYNGLTDNNWCTVAWALSVDGGSKRVWSCA